MKNRFLVVMAIVTALVIVLNTVLLSTRVIAAEPVGKENYAMIQINGATTLENKDSVASVQATFTNGIVTFTGTGIYSDGNNQIYAVGDVTVTATPDEDYTADLWVDGNDLKSATTTFTGLSAGGFKNMDAEFKKKETTTPTQTENTIPSEGVTPPVDGIDNRDEDPSRFNGQAYFVWMSGDNVCYHKFTGLTGMKSDGTGYDMNYVNVNELVDQSGNNGTYTWGQDNANWVLATDMEENGKIKTNLTKLYIFGDGTDNDHGVQLNPTNAKDGANSICSNGDMNFRVTIYRDSYQAVKFGTSPYNYEYFPFFWDQTFFTSTVDISGTTPENPAVYETYLLEPAILFSVGDNSKSNSITSVKALDVNPDAVTITSDDGVYTVKFNSSYYDHVVFAITTADGNTYYIRLARMTIRVTDNWGPNVANKDRKLTAQLYYPRTTNYSDYEVVATVVNKDGTTATSTLEVDSSDNIDGGRGLYYSEYSVSANRDDTEGVYFTAVYKGALTSENYGGTFSGSGKGVYFNCETRKLEYNK